MWIPRPAETRELAAFLRGTAPAAALVHGPPGSGRTSLVRRGLAEHTPPHTTRWFAAVALDRVGQRRLLHDTWLPDRVTDGDGTDGGRADGGRADGMGDGASGGSAGSTMPLPLSLVRDREPLTLVLDDIDHVSDPASIAADLGSLWQRARRQGLPLRMILTGTRDGIGRLMSEDARLADAVASEVRMRLVTPQEVAAQLPDWPHVERLQAWAAFGGRPGRLRHLDPGVRLATNVQRVFLDPTGPLANEGPRLLATLFQKPERYAGLVRALARGARDWGELRAAVPEFTSSSQLAPYLASLEAHGLVRGGRSLDARPGSRNRRYRLVDPCAGFWYAGVLPCLGQAALDGAPSAWRTHARGALDTWSARVFPTACRAFLRRPTGPDLPAAAREVGALWGEGYDLPVAGILRTGAPLYGQCAWGRPATEADADGLERAVRATRYGFGREARLRVVFAAGPVDHALRRREARDPLLVVVSLERLLAASPDTPDAPNPEERPVKSGEQGAASWPGP